MAKKFGLINQDDGGNIAESVGGKIKSRYFLGGKGRHSGYSTMF